MFSCNLIITFIQKEVGVEFIKREIQEARQKDGKALFRIACDYYYIKKKHYQSICVVLQSHTRES
jgi:hypothetical protein